MKLAPVGRVEVVNDGVVPSGSVADMPKVKSEFSLTDCAPIVAKTGAWFTLLTVIATISESTAAESSVA
ncbi:hypothetical protein TRIP_C10001 [Candidatus Zixiibacteriota bacterium]|nr:hypothetical protein TRIP_C10001 [candidate division Zixibacteria bacterium]